MNLIACFEDCLHEKDGFCSLEKDFFVNAHAHNGCHYFVDKSNAKIKPTRYVNLNEKTL